jgi:hypothetical protein
MGVFMGLPRSKEVAELEPATGVDSTSHDPSIQIPESDFG